MTDDFDRAAAAARAKQQGKPAPAAARAEPPPDELVARVMVPFPVEVLPRAVRDWALADSEGRQVPIEMSATFALMAMMSAAIRCDVQVGPDWREPCVSQMLLVAAPSQRKSPSFKKAFRPVLEQHEKQLVRIEAMRTSWRVRMTELEEQHPLAIKNEQTPEAQEHATLAKRIETTPKAGRRVAADVTPEEFMRLMFDNHETMVLASDEGDFFSNFGGRYASQEAKLSPLLNGWDCGYLPYDRVGQGGKRINLVLRKPRAGIAAAGQHKVLQDLLKNPVYRRKGLLARMLFVVLPERTALENLTPVSMRTELHEKFCAVIDRLFDASADDGALVLQGSRDQGNGWQQPDWLFELRARCSRGVIGEGEFQDIPDWAGKLVSNMARLAAVLELAGGGGARHLSQLADFFIAHARLALAGSTEAPTRGTEQEEQAYVLTRLVTAARKVPHASGKPAPIVARQFRMRDVRHLCKRFRTNAQLLPHLEALTENGFLTEVASSEAHGLGNKTQARSWTLREDLTLPPEAGGWDPDKKARSDVPF